ALSGAVNRSAGAGRERVKINRWMNACFRSDWLVEILFEVASAGGEDTQSKIAPIVRCHFVTGRPSCPVTEAWSSATRRHGLHPLARPASRVEFQREFLPVLARLVSLSTRVFRHRRRHYRSSGFECRWPPFAFADCRSFGRRLEFDQPSQSSQ